MGNNRPWNFDEARDFCRKASQRQETAAEDLVNSYKAAAEAEKNHARALALKIIELRDNGAPAVLAKDLAKGDDAVSDLKEAATIADGAREGMIQTGWRFAADRKDAQRFADWSQRREFAEAAGETEPNFEAPVGGQR